MRGVGQCGGSGTGYLTEPPRGTEGRRLLVVVRLRRRGRRGGRFAERRGAAMHDRRVGPKRRRGSGAAAISYVTTRGSLAPGAFSRSPENESCHVQPAHHG